MTEQLEGQMSIFEIFGQDIWSGKTCQEHSAQTKAKTSDVSSKKQRGSQIKMPLYLDLRISKDGVRQVALWEMGGALLGEYTMHSFGEYPSEEKESRLSQILQENPHPKYCLSARACQGILNRAEKRGKELPPLLKQTLLRQSVSKNGQDVRGGAKESSYNATEPEPCQHSITKQSCNSKVYGISGFESNAMKSHNPHSGIYEADTTRTLDLNGGNPACNQGGMIVLEGNGARESHKGDGYKETDKMYTLNTVEQHAVCYSQDAYDKFSENEKSASLKACGGTYGGGSEALAIQSGHCAEQITKE